MHPTAQFTNFTSGFIVPLSYAAHAAAQQFRQSRPLYLKALTVYAVEFYLRCLGLETDPSQSDWRDPWIAKWIDVADLWLEPYGKLECCMLLPEAEALTIAEDAWADRVGYLVVRLDPNLKSATLLGFVTAPAAEIPLAELQPLEQFPFYLQESQQQSYPVSAAASVNQPVNQPVNLRAWLTGMVAAGWQTVEALGSTQPQMVSVRSPQPVGISVRQAKLIDVGMDLGGQSVVLSLAVTLNPDTSMNVLVQTYPGPGSSRLPADLELAMLSETGERLQAVCSREQDSYIQLRHFRGEAGDSFEIEVKLDQASVTESFVL